MPTTYNILILGASYGSLLGTKLALAGHTVNLVCLPAEADLINREGAIVRLPVKGRDRLVEMQSKKLPGKLCAGGTPAFKPTAILRQLESDIEAARFDAGDGRIALPVKLKVHDSVFVPLAKWSTLIAGNYRCVQQDGMRSIKDAVHSDIAASRAIYNWVVKLSMSLGVAEHDLVPFDKYAQAALLLTSPSSAARALAAGAPHIERLDRLVQTIAAQHGIRSDVVDQTVALVDGWLEANRQKAA